MSLRRFEKALLVCVEGGQDVERRLVAAGCAVTRVSDGDGAIGQLHRELFDAAVLVSTGRDMDLVETVLNLIDIRANMPIVIVSDRSGATESAIRKITTTIPNTFQVGLDGLEALLAAARSCENMKS